MPDRTTLERARKDKRDGKSPSTQAGEFVHEEIKHIREGKHGARSTKQAIAIGLSKARRAGVTLKPPSPSTTSAGTRRAAARDERAGQKKKKGSLKPSARRAKASLRKLKSEPRSVVSHAALSRHAKAVARRKRSAGA
jgi:hypothetical protein